jgi:hypothetical protein
VDIEEFFQETNVPPRQWTRLATSQLRGSAYECFAPLITYGIEWTEFQRELLKRFDSAEVLRRARVELYGSRQPSNQLVENFIRSKVALARRLDPNMKAADLVALITDLLRPEIRRQIRPYSISNLERLIDVARQIEEDFDITPPRKQPKPVAPSTMEQSPASRPPPCRSCPGRHWYRDCPERNRIQEPVRDSGNARPTEVVITPSPRSSQS